MKRISILFLCLLLILSMTACHKSAGDEETTENTSKTAGATEQKEAESTTKSGKSSVVEKGDYVELTLPASYYDGVSEEDIKKASQESGYKKCTINQDGSVTYTMTKAQRQELLDEMKETIDGTITSITTGESATGAITSVKYNKDMTKFNIYVNGDSYTQMTTLNAILFYTSGSYYQTINGVAEEDVEITVQFIDNETGEVYDTETYSDYLKTFNS